MQHLSLKFKFLLLSALMSLALVSIGYFSSYYLSKNHYLGFISQMMTDHQTLYYQTAEDLKKLELPEPELKNWLGSNINSMGFIKDSEKKQTLFMVRRYSDNTFGVEISEVSFLAWLESIDTKLLLTFLSLSILLGVFSFIYLSFALSPLKRLRRATEDILAGRLDMNLSYNANDELGMIYRSLGKLTKDLEIKDQALEKYTELATTDGMTGLKNHRFFKESFQRELNLAKRHNDICGLILLDVDHFKKFNDTYGHQQGDEVLRGVAKTLKDLARNTDVVARYGGEEFVVVLPRTDIEGLKIAAEKLRSALETTKVPHLAEPGKTLSVTASFGVVAISGSDAIDPTYTLYVETADKNLYEAKKRGRNCAVVSQWKHAA